MKISDELKAKIKHISAESMEQKGIVQRARVGYICPICRDGSGRDGTGMSVKQEDFGTSWYCGKCAKAYDNISILAAYFGLDYQKDFAEIIQLTCELFGIDENSDLSFVPAQKKVVEPDKYKKIVEYANSQLPAFLQSQGGTWRGLTFDTLNRYMCGFKSDFYGQQGEPPLPHVIIPSSFNHILARLLGKPDDYPQANGNDIKTKPHFGPKEIFGLKPALNSDPVIFISEGEIDAMSIWQASTFNAISFSGVVIKAELRDKIKPQHIGDKIFVVLFDNDSTGKEKTDLAVSVIQSLGQKAVAFSLSDTHKDANDFLVANSNGLKNRLLELHQQAKSLFDKPVPVKVSDDRINHWQEFNGVINPNTLRQLHFAFEQIQNVSNFYHAATDTSFHHYLGLCRFFSCFSDAEKNFFASLRHAKDHAKNKIRAFNKFVANANSYEQSTGIKTAPDPSLQPSDDERALADLNIKKLSETVDTCVTAVKKAHKKWLKQKEADDLNAKCEAARLEYENNPPSTRQFVPDCPVDLILPEGVFFSEEEISIVDWDKPAGQNGRTPIRAAKNPIVPTRIFREPQKRYSLVNTGKTQYELAIKTDYGWQFVIVDGEQIVDPRGIAKLGNQGALVTNSRFLCRYLVEIIALNNQNGRLKTTLCYFQPGWQDDKFQFFAYPTGGDNYIVKNGDFDYREVFSPRGDVDLWKKMFHRVLFHDPKSNSISDKPNLNAAIILGASIGTPLVAPLGIRNPQLNLGFDSGNGKTAAAKFAVSFYGDPRTLCPTCNATENFLDDLAVKLNDFPHSVDELQAAKKHVRENFDELVYKFDGGTTRGRADINGNAKPTYKYRGFRLFTGEQSIINDNSGQGAISRIFELKKADLFADSFAIELHNFIREHYGFFGKSFTTEFIPNHLDEIRKFFKELRTTLADNNDLLSNHSSILAYAVTGLYFGLQAVGYSMQEITHIIAEVFKNLSVLIDDAPAKSQASNRARALPALLDFVDSHPKNFILEKMPENGSGIPGYEVAFGNETFGVKLDDGSVAFYPLTLKKILNELGFPSANAIIRSFGEHHFFQGFKSNHKSYQSRLSSTFNKWVGKTSWFYVLKSPEKLDELNDQKVAA